MQTVSLSGTGIDFTLAPTTSTTATITAGSSAYYSLQLSSLTSLTGNIALACTGAPANATCNVAPPNAQLGSTIPITVTVVTTAAIAQRLPAGSSIYLALLLPLALPFLRRRRRLPLTLCILLTAASLIALNGCAGSRIIPSATAGGTGSSSPTPTGTYTLTISATADGLTHTVPLTLTIQ